MLDRLVYPPSVKKICISFAIAAAGTVMAFGGKFSSDAVRAGLTHDVVVADPQYPAYLESCVQNAVLQDFNEKADAVRKQMLSEENPHFRPEDFLPMSQAEEDAVTESCKTIAENSLRRALHVEKTWPELIIGFELGGGAAFMGAVTEIMGLGCLGFAAYRRKRDQIQPKL